MSHTPGGWFADGSTVEHFDAPLKPDIAVCANDQIHSLPVSSEETESNARLIAAAPELLEACKMAHDLLLKPYTSDVTARVCGFVSGAIAKAEGK